MRYLVAGLVLALFAHQALAKTPSTDNRLVRLVCQNYYVLILEQLSSKSVDTETALSDTTDGTVLIDPGHSRRFTDNAAFRLRVYEAPLVSTEEGTREGKQGFRDQLTQLTGSQAVRDLLARAADFDGSYKRMDYTGIGFRSGKTLIFKHEGDFLKGVEISMEDFTGFMDTNHGASNPEEDGPYRCGKPALLPETAGN